MRRRIILYIVGGLLALCVIISVLAPKTDTPSAAPTDPAQRVATIALPTDTPAPSPTKTARPTRAPSHTPAPSITATAIPTKAPTQVPPTKAPATKAPPTAIPPTAAPAASCPGGCTEHVAGCDIKGNVNSDGDKIYHRPGMSAYNNTKVKPEEGDRWFCTEAEAKAAGFRRAGQ